MKRPSPFNSKRLLATAVMATWGINLVIDHLVIEGSQRSPASEEESASLDVQIEKTTHQKLEELLSQWTPELIISFEQGLRSKALALVEKHQTKQQELEKEVKARDLSKSEELKAKVVEFQDTLNKDISALEDETKALQKAQEQAKLLDADLNLQLKSTSAEQLPEIQGDIQKIDVFSKLALSNDLLSSALGLKQEVEDMIAQVEVMKQQVVQLEENKKLLEEVEANKETLSELRKEMIELKCEKQRAIKQVPVEEQEAFLEDISKSAQKLALLERTALTSYPELQAPISMIYDQHNLGGIFPSAFWGNTNQMNSPFFQWQNMALMNSWLQQAMMPYQSPLLYSQYGIFGGNTQNGQSGMNGNNMNWPGQSIYGNNNVVNYYLPYNSPQGQIGQEMGRAPSAAIPGPAINASGVGVQLGQPSFYQFSNFSGAPTGGTTNFGFKF